jgi:hypothetical protein
MSEPSSLKPVWDVYLELLIQSGCIELNCIPVRRLDETEEENVQRIEPLVKANLETLKSIKSLIRKHR